MDRVLLANGFAWISSDVEDPDALLSVCGSCSKAFEKARDGNPLVAVVYRRDSDRADWDVNLCSTCADDFVGHLGLELD